ncbi:MAG: BlaI/MecI/CopY family transcriptional regulator [Planctomycetota bacterium]
MGTQHLADGELSVLKALWHLGPSPVRDVRDRLRDRGHDLAYNTVQTVLSRLVGKELVSCDKSETPHVFRALVSRERFRRDRVRELVTKVYDGAAGAMALQAVRHGRLSADEIDALQQMLGDLAREQKSKKGRRQAP